MEAKIAWLDEKADDLLNEAVDKMDKHSLVHVTCVGHTHIDMAWLWRLKHTHEKASRSFSTVLRMMEMFPEYVFLQTQPQIYQYIKEDFPEIYQGIKEKIKEGRWEASLSKTSLAKTCSMYGFPMCSDIPGLCLRS